MQVDRDCPQILREFLSYHETIKGQSKKTVAEYYLDLRMFLRFVVLIKNARNQFLHALLPRSYNNVRLNGQALSDDAVFKILAMLSIYLMLLVVSTAISALGNTGPALGDTGPAFTWAWLPDAAKWYLSFMMLVGRLEIFTVMVIFTPMFWKN